MGVITKAALTSDDQSQLPCIAIPDSLAITPQLAGAKLQELLSSVGLSGASDLSAELLVALYIAFERSRGQQSKYYPYLMTMPKTPSCGVMLSDEDAKAALASAFGEHQLDLHLKNLRAAEAAYKQEIEEAEDYMDALNLDVPDVWWALGQALSRAYGNEPILIPVVDCVNHSRHTTPPLTIKNDEGQKLTCISNFDRGLTVQELAEGEEVFVNYGGRGGFESTAFEMFIDYGFVPEELQELAQGVTAHSDGDSDLEGF